MANNDAFALQHSDLNSFLFADIGVEASGTPLSVLSILARLDLDPWQEAGRLASLPRCAATDSLAQLIATLPANSSLCPDSTAVASRLVGLLPSRSSSTIVTPAHVPTSVTAWTSQHWAVALTVLGCVFAGLLLNVVGQSGIELQNHASARVSANHRTPPAMLRTRHPSTGE